MLKEVYGIVNMSENLGVLLVSETCLNILLSFDWRKDYTLKIVRMDCVLLICNSVGGFNVCLSAATLHTLLLRDSPTILQLYPKSC